MKALSSVLFCCVVLGGMVGCQGGLPPGGGGGLVGNGRPNGESCSSHGECASQHCATLQQGGGICSTSPAGGTGGQALAGEVGSSCGSNKDCKQGLCSTGLPGGYCTASCGGGDHAGGCPNGSTCVSSPSGASTCLFNCSNTKGCRDGYFCRPIGPNRGACYPKCTGNTDCLAGFVCDVSLGACIQGSRDAGILGKIGGACKADADCSGSVCVPQWPDGYCSAKCSEQDTTCPAGGQCVKIDASNAVCLGSCQGNQDCRPSYFCASLSGGGGACIPRCRANSDCNDGFQCDSLSGQCAQSSGTQPVAVRVERREIGQYRLSENLQTVHVDVPQGAISMLLVLTSEDTKTFLGMIQILEPSGKLLFKVGDPRSRMRVLTFSTGSHSVLVPNTPSVSLQAGRYEIVLQAEREVDARLTAIFKFANPPPTTGRLDVNCFFVGVPNLSAATAPSDQKFQEILKHLQAYWSKLGISIGQVKYLDIEEPYATQYSVVRFSELGNLYVLSRGQTNQAINLFFVREITGDAPGMTILGITGGLPGAALIHGTTSSGVTIATEQYSLQTKSIANTAAHEGGHFLGLFHLSERDGSSHDPLQDTPECTSSLDTNGNKMIDASECIGFGADNLMFWLSSKDIEQGSVTPHQRFVVMQNPLVQ